MNLRGRRRKGWIQGGQGWFGFSAPAGPTALTAASDPIHRIPLLPEQPQCRKTGMAKDAVIGGGHFYRPEIDGLRAVAVLAVILFHYHFGLPGGFAGVDIFFVISGYLISGIIKRELEKGTFSISQFWERRIRRIIPAAAVTVFLTVGVGFLVLTSDDLRALGKSVIANSFFSSNIYFWKTIDYFTDTATGLPLLHTWSLAVEEQFYLLFPLSLWFIHSKTESKRDLLIKSIIVSLFSVSLLISIFGVYLIPQATFYLLPMRAWEILLGVGINYLPRNLIPNNKIFRESFSWIGIALIVYTFIGFTDKTPFPGLRAIIPCFGTALIILSNASVVSGVKASTCLSKVLSFRPLVFIGLISYSLYLFHWPVLVYAQYLSPKPLEYQIILALLGIVLALSSASLIWLERPFRSKIYLSSRNSVFIFAIVSVAAMFGSGYLVWKIVPSRFAKQETVINKFIHERVDSTIDVDENQVEADNVHLFGRRDSNNLAFLLLGDSHARMGIPAFDTFASEHGLSFAAITFSSAQPLIGYRDPSSNAQKLDSIKWVKSSIDYVERHKIRLVVLAAKWDDAFVDLGTSKFQSLLSRTIAAFNAVGAGVYLMIDIPNYKASVPRHLILDLGRGKHPGAWHMTPAEYEEYNAPFLSLKLSLTRYRVRYLDPRPYLMDKSGGHYIVTSEGASIYYDDHHLTIPATRKYLGAMLKAEFSLDPF